MALNTPHNVTLTEGQIGVILCSLEKSVKYADSEYIEEVDTIFNILEGSVDSYYYSGVLDFSKIPALVTKLSPLNCPYSIEQNLSLIHI